MDNKIFLEMQQIGYAFWKENEGNIASIPKPFSLGQSYAFKFWSIAQQYKSTEIIVDDLPHKEEICDFLLLYRNAKVLSFVLTDNLLFRFDELDKHGCKLGEICRVRRILELGTDEYEIISGHRIYI